MPLISGQYGEIERERGRGNQQVQVRNQHPLSPRRRAILSKYFHYRFGQRRDDKFSKEPVGGVQVRVGVGEELGPVKLFTESYNADPEPLGPETLEWIERG